jgi:ABC-type transporter Mla subunit MlaD
VDGIDPRLNQTALALSSLIDEPELRDKLSRYLRDRHADLARTRARDVVSRTMSAVRKAFEDTERLVVPLNEITDRVNAASDAFSELVTTRRVGRVLREHSIPLRKSNGTIVAVNQPLARAVGIPVGDAA